MTINYLLTSSNCAGVIPKMIGENIFPNLTTFLVDSVLFIKQELMVET